MLSAIEKMIFLKEVPFFAELSIEELKVMGGLCEEAFFEENAVIFREGEPGGALYVVVSGRVAIEREAHRKGAAPARLAVLGSHAFFGEMTLFDDSPRSASAIAVQDTMTLKLSRQAITMLAMQRPDLSLGIINGLSQRLRQANDKIAELLPKRTREVHKLYDKLDTKD